MTREDINQYNVMTVVGFSFFALLLTVFTCGIPLSIAFALFVYSQNFAKEGKRLVLFRDGEYHDLGEGRINLGLFRFFYDVKYYDTRARNVTLKDVRLQVKDGSFFLCDVQYSWSADADKLDKYFSDDWDQRLRHGIPVFLQMAAKNLPPRVIFGADWSKVMEIVIADNDLSTHVLITGPFISNLRTESGKDLSGHIRDDTALIESAIGEIESEGRLESVRVALKEAYPDREHRIDRLIGNRIAELRRRGIRG